MGGSQTALKEWQSLCPAHIAKSEVGLEKVKDCCSIVPNPALAGDGLARASASCNICYIQPPGINPISAKMICSERVINMDTEIILQGELTTEVHLSERCYL